MQYNLGQIMVFLGARMFNKPEVFVTFGNTRVNDSGTKIADAATRDAIRAQLTAFVADIAS